MRAQDDKPNHVRQLTLPSGRHIDVLYYENPADQGLDHDLGLCGTCACTLVQPLQTEPVGRSHWRVTLWCPNCLWVGTGVFTDESLESFSESRGRDIGVIRRELEQISRANMIEDTEQFVRALDCDHILPSDF